VFFANIPQIYGRTPFLDGGYRDGVYHLITSSFSWIYRLLKGRLPQLVFAVGPLSLKYEY